MRVVISRLASMVLKALAAFNPIRHQSSFPNKKGQHKLTLFIVVSDFIDAPIPVRSSFSAGLFPDDAALQSLF